MSHSSKLIEPKEGVVGISDLQLVGPKHRIIWTCDWDQKWGQSCGSGSLACSIWCRLWVDSVRIGLNFSPAGWCQRTALCEIKSPTNQNWCQYHVIKNHFTSSNPAQHTKCTEFKQIPFIVHFFYVKKRYSVKKSRINEAREEGLCF